VGDREPARLADVLEGVGKRLGLDHAVRAGRLWRAWREVVGSALADHAEPTSLRGGVLRVRADSPAWATEIGYLGEVIRQRVNGFFGQELVSEVRVWTGPGRIRRPPAPAPAADDPSPRPPARHPAQALERARRAWALRRAERR
jgi:predicted nucleic acid-binding Zn ribbon protein